MNRISIDVSKDELDFIREAVAQKYLNLMAYLHTCEEEESRKQQLAVNMPKVAKLAADQLDKELDAWFGKVKGKKIVAKKAPRKSADAPYGYKKDGTPKKRPGRKVAA